MSFGFSIADLATATALAWKLYRACKESANEFQQISSDVSNVHLLLKEIEESITEDNNNLSHTRAQRLAEIHDNASNVLTDLDAQLARYNNLPTSSRRTWDAIRFGFEDVGTIRTRLTATTSALAAFQSTLVSSSQVRIERLLMKFLREVSAGLHEGSVLSTQTGDSINTTQTWQQLRRELEDIGITTAVLDEKRDFIVSILRRALEEGIVDQAEVPDLNFGTDMSTLVPSTTHDETLREESTRSGLTATEVDQNDGNGDAVAPSSPTIRRERMTLRRFSSLIRSLRVLGPDLRMIKAADKGDLGSILQLIEVGASVHARDRWKWTALHMAAYGGYNEIAGALIAAGAEVNAVTVDDETPLELARMKNHNEVAYIIECELERRARQI